MLASRLQQRLNAVPHVVIDYCGHTALDTNNLVLGLACVAVARSANALARRAVEDINAAVFFVPQYLVQAVLAELLSAARHKSHRV